VIWVQGERENNCTGNTLVNRSAESWQACGNLVIVFDVKAMAERFGEITHALSLIDDELNGFTDGP
jgi:hypothetical protein